MGEGEHERDKFDGVCVCVHELHTHTYISRENNYQLVNI